MRTFVPIKFRRYLQTFRRFFTVPSDERENELRNSTVVYDMNSVYECDDDDDHRVSMLFLVLFSLNLITFCPLCFALRFC